MKKLFNIIINAILVLIPFFPILENFFPNQVDNSTFGSYLLHCLVISVLMLVLMLISTRDYVSSFFGLKLTAILLFILGMIVMIPLHLGPPRSDESLIVSSYIEKTRYALLIIAVVIVYIAIFLFLKKFWTRLNTFEKLITIPLIAGLPFLLWDNYDSFMFTEKLNDWKNSGKDSKDFFLQYVIIYENWRATGRILLYISTIWFAIILMHHSLIKKWKGIIITIFSIIGVLFCFGFLFVNSDLYFPFMVPAVVIAPLYWLGLSILNEKNS